MRELVNRLTNRPAPRGGTIPPRSGNLSIPLLGGLRTFVC